jgi:hypothetical protein
MPTKLQAGCYWRFDWFRNSDNPNHSFTQIQCPAELVSRSGCKRSDDSSFPAFVMPAVTTWNPPTPTETAGANAQCDGPTWDVAKAVRCLACSWSVDVLTDFTVPCWLLL